MDDKQIEVLAVTEQETPVEPMVPEQVPVPAVPKRKYTHRANGEQVRVQVVGYLTVCLGPEESLSAGQLADLIGVDPVVVGYHCRALVQLGTIGCSGEKRGRKYHAIRS